MSDMSRSKQKRMEQEKARSAQHRKKAVATFWKIFIPLLIVAAIAGGVILYQRSKLDYSRYLNDNGSIKGNGAFLCLDGQVRVVNLEYLRVLVEEARFEGETVNDCGFDGDVFPSVETHRHHRFARFVL